jgi:hypothetical protein
MTLSSAAWLIFAVFAQSTNSQWVKTNGPGVGSSVLVLSNFGTSLFAGTNGAGIFISKNNGETWTIANDGLTHLRVFSFAKCGGNIFAGTSAGVFLSANDGLNWSTANTGLLICPLNFGHTKNQMYLFSRRCVYVKESQAV